MITNLLLITLRTTLVTLLLCGLGYPLLVTVAALALFPSEARGSLVQDEQHRVVGSALIGQRWQGAGYFHGRPSAAGDGYDALASGGANLGPTSRKLHERVNADRKLLIQDNPQAPGAAPADLLTTSASGLDPHISPEAALWQAPRVAKARGLRPERVRDTVLAHTEGRTFGVLGEPRVNVLLLNLALDLQFGRSP